VASLTYQVQSLLTCLSARITDTVLMNRPPVYDTLLVYLHNPYSDQLERNKTALIMGTHIYSIFNFQDILGITTKLFLSVTS
jgi:hypothetical protein